MLAILAFVVASLVLGGCRATPSTSQSAVVAGSGHLAHTVHRQLPGELPPRVAGGGRPGSRDLADGEVPDGVTVFDDRYAAVARLDPDLLGALREAASAAAHDGVRFYVDSGWRSRVYQEELFHEAVARYGSVREAARWVAHPGTSPHEAGAAVDLGPAATVWLSANGASYGLCQIYANEPWHYELRPDAVAHGCPAMYADPTHDPRLQQ